MPKWPVVSLCHILKHGERESHLNIYNLFFMFSEVKGQPVVIAEYKRTDPLT